LDYFFRRQQTQRHLVRRAPRAHFAIAVVGVVLSSPLALLTALAIKLESPGPIFYKQERVGKNGRRFTIIKSARCARTRSKAAAVGGGE